jgi:hypothetical protein
VSVVSSEAPTRRYTLDESRSTRALRPSWLAVGARSALALVSYDDPTPGRWVVEIPRVGPNEWSELPEASTGTRYGPRRGSLAAPARGTRSSPPVGRPVIRAAEVVTRDPEIAATYRRCQEVVSLGRLRELLVRIRLGLGERVVGRRCFFGGRGGLLARLAIGRCRLSAAVVVVAAGAQRQDRHGQDAGERCARIFHGFGP